MKGYPFIIAFVFGSSVAFGQVSKQVGKIYEENKYRKAIKVGERVDEYLSAADRKVVYDVVGRSYYALQMYDSTVYFENKALSLDNDATSTSGWGYTYRGMALYRQGRKEEGILDLQKAIKLNKTHNSVEVAKAFLGDVNTNSVPDDRYAFYFSQGEYKNAIEEGRKQLQKKEYKGVMQIVGAAYVYTHNYDSAIYFERKALAVDRDSTLVSGWAHVYLGIALHQENEKEQAIDELRKAIELDKTSNSARKTEKYLDAIINGRAVAIDSVHQSIKDQLNGGSYRVGANVALALLSANPDDALAWDQLATAYYWLHNYDSSLICGQKAVASDKEQSAISSDAHYHMGIDRFMKNDLEAAETEFSSAISDHTGNEMKKKVSHARFVMGLDDNYTRWKTVETDDLIFHFQNKKSIDDVDALISKYEKEYHNAHSVLPAPLPKKIDVFVWEHSIPDGGNQQSNRAYPEYCLVHITPDNSSRTQIVHILGRWQKRQ